MNIEQEIRAQIEKNKGLKLAVGEINNHLSILEGLLRNERDDVQKQVDKAYQRGLEDGKKAFDLLDAERDSEYQRGLEDAWEAARKLFSSMADSDIEKAFPIEWNNGGFKALMNLQPQEAIEKLKAYEEKQKHDDKIEVGDEVKHNAKLFVVTVAGDAYVNGISIDGTWCYASVENAHKTGRHFDIASILEDMRHD